MKRIKDNDNATIVACYIGYITQAIVNNFVPLLFVTFQKQFGIALDKIGLLISVNFGVQLLVDLLAAGLVEKVGERKTMITAHLCSGTGLLLLAFLPWLFPVPYIGLLIGIVCYAIGGGLIEVMLSPIVEACQTKNKEAVMSSLHSFYCWGHVGVVLISTLYFAVFGTGSWWILACIWAVIPFFNTCLFFHVPIRSLVEAGKSMGLREIFRERVFWILFIVMVCAGAAEQGMSQWASAFAEMGLSVSKTVGDLAGPCMFAACMGAARAWYGAFSEKIRLHNFMMISGLLCVAAYLLAGLSKSPVLGLAGCALCGLSVGIMWPGSFSTAAKVLRRGGTIMFAFLALAGDLGCSAGPGLVGMISELSGRGLKAGLFSAIVFPVILVAGIWMIKQENRR